MSGLERATHLSQLQGKPEWTVETVGEVLLDAWGRDAARVRPLVSERDQNWGVVTGEGDHFVLKVVNSADSVAEIDLQQQMMSRLAERGVAVPVPIAATDGQTVLRHGPHLVWMITHLGGVTLARTSRPTPRLFTGVGRLIATLCDALADFDHPAAHREIQWDVQQAPQILQGYRGYVADPAQRALLDTQLRRWQHEVNPRLANLPRAVIHNDCNDHNLLVEGEQICGLIDFGDAVHSVQLNELAIACTYAMLGRDDPLATMSQIVSGYQQDRALTTTEREVLLDLVRIRLATSVSISAYQRRQVEDDTYLTISEEPAWHLLKRLDSL